MPNADSFIHGFEEQLKWLEGLGAAELKLWLRGYVWAKRTYPLVVPNVTDRVTQFISLVKAGTPALIVSVRSVIPELLKEWGRDDTTDVLEKLFLLCGKLRCADAEASVIQILNSRLSARSEVEETKLRSLGLGVLSGFGCTDRTAYLFERYIGEKEYALVSYRALYKYNPTNAAVHLPVLVEIYQDHRAEQKLKMNIKRMLEHLPSSAERAALWNQVLRDTEENKIPMVLKKLADIGILYQPPDPVEDDSLPERIPVAYEEEKGWVGFPTNYVEVLKLKRQLGENQNGKVEEYIFNLYSRMMDLHQQEADSAVANMAANA